MRYLLLLASVLSIGFVSCDKDVPGCMDSSAQNFNPEATTSDGSCVYAGCTDPTADNYNPDATVDSGNCQYGGCIDINSDQYDATANTDDGTCETYFNRWSASFEGAFECGSEIISDAFGVAIMTFSRIEGNDSPDSIEVFIETSVTDIPLNFNAYITRDSLYAAAFFPDYPTEIANLSEEDNVFDISVSGVLGINEENSEISGVLTVDLKHATLPINPNDTCGYTGVKQ